MSATNSIQSWLDWAAQQFVDSDTAKLDAKVLLCHVLDCQMVYLHTWPEKELEGSQVEHFQGLVKQRVAGQPIAYIVGYREFWSLKLKVSEHTLIPRPDTEILVGIALQLPLPSAARVLDLGTGTGAIALALASEQASWRIAGLDKHPGAVALARENAVSLNLQQVNFLQSDWFSALEQQSFDLIISNPPYVETDSPYLHQGDVRFEPDSALTSGQDGLDDIRQIICNSRDYLAEQGWLMLEHGYQQAESIQSLFAQAGYTAVTTHNDLNNLARVTLAKFEG